MADKAWQKHDETWLRLLQSGDHEAFAEFIDKYKSTVFMCCRRLGLREDEAEDVASETFIAAYKGFGRYRGRAELGTWVWSIAYKRGVSFLRKNRRYDQLLLEPDEQVASADDRRPGDGLEAAEQEDLIWRCVERLPRLWAVAIILYYREDKSLEDICGIMKLNSNTVKTYLYRGRQRLKELLGDASKGF